MAPYRAASEREAASPSSDSELPPAAAITMLRFRLSSLLPLLGLGLLALLCYCAYFGAVEPLWEKVTPRDLARERLVGHAGAGGGNRSGAVDEADPLDLLEDSDDDSEVFWLAQVSDLHFSAFWDPARSSDFGLLCSLLASAASEPPRAVILTGDLTDGKERSFYGSTQQPVEWETYARVVKTCRDLTPTTKWLDIRGNHDAFDVLEDNGLYLRSSVRGEEEAMVGSYSETVKLPGGRTLGLVSVDATPKPGLKRPFNFFGSMRTSEVLELESLLNRSRSENDFTVAFGHYPTSVINAAPEKRKPGAVPEDSPEPPKSLRAMLAAQPDSLYLCGHLHHFMGLAYDMYSRHRSGLLELELTDWKENRFFRLLAFDKDGTFAFTDQKFTSNGSTNAAVVVLHPKNALFMLDSESFSEMRKKRSVRLLAISELTIKKVEVSFDGERSYAPLFPSGQVKGLYTGPFDPARFSEGLHSLTVRVSHSDGSEVLHRDSFSLDGSHEDFPAFGSLLLLADWLPFMMGLFASVALAYASCLAFLRTAHACKASSANSRMRINRKLPWLYQTMLNQLRKLWILCTIDPLFWPLLGAAVYTCFFPWSIARVMTSRHALIFVWGIVFLEDWAYMPPDMTFAYGIVSFLFYLGPLTLVLANKASERFAITCYVEPTRIPGTKPPPPVYDEPGLLATLKPYLLLPWRHLGILVILFLAAFQAREIYFSYGLICSLSPWGVGRVVFAAALYRSAMGLGRGDFFEVMQVWAPQ